MNHGGEHVLICVAWPYANGPLHLGHVAGCYLPPDIQARFERAIGNRVLMVSGSDEHGTPITVTAEQEGVKPQDIIVTINGSQISNLRSFYEKVWKSGEAGVTIELGALL